MMVTDYKNKESNTSVGKCDDSIKHVLLTSPVIGICEVDIDKLVCIWDSLYWSISQWEEEYSLVKVSDSGVYDRCKISKQQAHELIGKLNLVDEKSLIFNSGRIWRQVLHPLTQIFKHYTHEAQTRQNQT